MTNEVRCPTDERFPGDIIGCGSANVEWDDEEQVYECLDCGIWFPAPSEVRS